MCGAAKEIATVWQKASVIATDPATEAVLGKGQPFYVRVTFDLGLGHLGSPLCQRKTGEALLFERVGEPCRGRRDAWGFVVLRIIAGTSYDPTSHNLWPFEILSSGIVTLTFGTMFARLRGS